MGGGGKGGGGAVSVAPSPYEQQMAAIAGDIYKTTDPLRKIYLSDWENFLSPKKVLRPGAVPIQGAGGGGNAIYGGLFVDPLTGSIYGGDKVQHNLAMQAGTINNPGILRNQVDTPEQPESWFVDQMVGGMPYQSITPGEDYGKWYNTQTYYNPIKVEPLGNVSGGGTGELTYRPEDYITQRFNPADLPGYTPSYDIARRGLESQYNTALDQIAANTPRGGAMDDALARLELSRAESIGQLPMNISSPLIADMLNKSYGAAFNAPSQSLTGLGAANQGYVAQQNAALAAQAQQQGSKTSGLGLLGVGLGNVVGGMLA